MKFLKARVEKARISTKLLAGVGAHRTLVPSLQCTATDPGIVFFVHDKYSVSHLWKVSFLGSAMVVPLSLVEAPPGLFLSACF